MGREKEKAVVPTVVLKDQVGVMMFRGTSGFFLRPLNVLLFAKPMFWLWNDISDTHSICE